MSAVPTADDFSSQLVILDASTIINLLIADAWTTLLHLNGYQMASTKIVTQQIIHVRQKSKIQGAVANGSLQLVDAQIPSNLLRLFPDWVRRFGEQDASVLANALAMNAWMGADDRSLCNEAQRQGVAKILGTEELLAEMVRQGSISLDQGNRKLKKLKDARVVLHVPCLCSLLGISCTCETSRL